MATTFDGTRTPGPTGTEALVCEDIARRQQLGIAKYGTTVADNPLLLAGWLRHAYEEALDLAVYLRRALGQLQAEQPAAAPPPAAPKITPTHGRYQYLGQPVSIQQLADLAGCTWGCMQQRLRTRTPEDAVAMGAPGSKGVHRPAQTAAATDARVATARRHRYQGQDVTAAQLAALAGCPPRIMHLRLRHNSAEEAVALGPVRERGRRAFQAPAGATLPPAPPAPPARGPRLTAAVNPTLMPPKEHNPFRPDAAVIVPPNVKRTVAPPVPDRFAIRNAPSHFSGRAPGQYDADAQDTPLARVLSQPKP